MKNFNELLDSLSNDDIKALYDTLHTTNNTLPYLHIILRINTIDDVVAIRTKYTSIRRKEIIDSLL